jgi:hypothetical protein
MRVPASTRRRWLVDYLQATGNEIELDRVAFGLAGMEPHEVGYFPRPSKWLKYASRSRGALRTLWLVCRPIWHWGGGAAFQILELARFGVRHLLRGGAAAAPLSQNGYVLALSSRVGDIVRPPGIEQYPSCWLTLPWAPIQTPPAGCREVEMLSLLTAGELWQCSMLAIRATAALPRRTGCEQWGLQSYTAFRWFAVRMALEKLDGRFLMCEHFDRWAVVADSVVRARRRGGAVRGEAPFLVLVQHGEIGRLSPADWTGSFYSRLRRKLGAVTLLYAYDADSAEIFKSGVLTRRCARRLRVEFQKPRIALRPVAADRGCRLLFVGHPVCEPLHVLLLERVKGRDVRVFYKPHPMAGMSAAMSKHDWIIIEDKTEFPEVDLLISYPSTLVTEYAAWNVPAAVHPLHLEPRQAGDFADALERRVRGILASHPGGPGLMRAAH